MIIIDYLNASSWLKPKAEIARQEILECEMQIESEQAVTDATKQEVEGLQQEIGDLEKKLTEIGKKNRIARLTADLMKNYDRLILDCPPVLNELSSQIVRAADLIVVPIPPSPLSARALETVRDEVQSEGKKAPPIMPVFSMVDRRRALHRDSVASEKGWPAVPASTCIRGIMAAW